MQGARAAGGKDWKEKRNSADLKKRERATNHIGEM